MIIWSLVILIVLFALIVFVNRKRSPDERTQDYWGLYDLRRPKYESEQEKKRKDGQEQS